MKKTLRYSVLTSSILLAMGASAAEEGISVHGYFNYSTGFFNDPILNTDAYNWSKTGNNTLRLPGHNYSNSSAGRLGNDGRWVQIQTDYITSQNDMTWGAHVMFSTGASGAGTYVPEHAYADAKGVISSNPGATIWVGKKYVDRVNVPLVVTEALGSDGTGFGLEDLNLGFGKLYLSVTRNLYNSYSNTPRQGDMTAFSSAIHDLQMPLGLKANVYFNYATYVGPNRDNANASGGTISDLYPDAHQVAFKLMQGDYLNGHEFFVRYGADTRQKITAHDLYGPTPSDNVGGFFTGHYQINDSYHFEYTLAHETEKFNAESRAYNSDANVSGTRGAVNFSQRDWTSFIVRNTYTWNTKTSTQLELGYEQLEYDALTASDDGTNKANKITLAQNIHIGPGLYDRPMMSFYVTRSELDVGTTVSGGTGVALGKKDAVTVGARFEAWF
ncbi:hypothetical protein CBF23_013340 [Marinomonas agarivorans]|nr:hypothetical protein CBF23_013340 [Marinomonas agarivorans]